MTRLYKTVSHEYFRLVLSATFLSLLCLTDGHKFSLSRHSYSIRQSDSASVSHTNRIDSEAILYRKKGSMAYSQYNSKDSEVDTVTDDTKLRNSNINLNFLEEATVSDLTVGKEDVSNGANRIRSSRTKKGGDRGVSRKSSSGTKKGGDSGSKKGGSSGGSKGGSSGSKKGGSSGTKKGGGSGSKKSGSSGDSKGGSSGNKKGGGSTTKKGGGSVTKKGGNRGSKKGGSSVTKKSGSRGSSKSGTKKKVGSKSKKGGSKSGKAGATKKKSGGGSFQLTIDPPQDKDPLPTEPIPDPSIPPKIKGFKLPRLKTKNGIPESMYKYRRSDLDRESELYIPASLRNRWKLYLPSRMAVGMPLAQEGNENVAAETIQKWEAGKTPPNLNGVPMDFFPNPIDPPNYKSEQLDVESTSFD